MLPTAWLDFVLDWSILRRLSQCHILFNEETSIVSIIYYDNSFSGQHGKWSILSAFSSEYLWGNVFPAECFVSDLPSPSYNKPPNGALIDVHVTPASSPVPLFQSETPVSSFSLRTKTQTCTPVHTQRITLSLHFLTHAFLALKSLSLSFSFHMHIFISPEALCLSPSQIMC